jgi:hypothetical protein
MCSICFRKNCRNLRFEPNYEIIDFDFVYVCGVYFSKKIKDPETMYGSIITCFCILWCKRAAKTERTKAERVGWTKTCVYIFHMLFILILLSGASTKKNLNIMYSIWTAEKNQQRCCVQSINVENLRGYQVSFRYIHWLCTVVQFIIQPKVSDDILSLNRWWK